MADRITYVGLDVHKEESVVAVATGGLRGEVREYGRIANTPTALERLLRKLGGDGVSLRFWCEAGPCGYGIQRQVSATGMNASWFPPSLIPKRVGDRVKTDRRDAASLARLHRAGELTVVWAPDARHEAMLPNWTLAPVVAALQTMRGMVLVNAATLIAELGDLSRFANLRQLMAYLGLVPSEHSSGVSVKRGGITKAGNGAARRLLIEAAWSYRLPARISRKLLLRQEKQPKPIRDIAWKGECGCVRPIASSSGPASPPMSSPPRSTVLMTRSGWAVQTKAFGLALVSARTRVMAACNSTIERNTPV